MLYKFCDIFQVIEFVFEGTCCTVYTTVTKTLHSVLENSLAGREVVVTS